MVERSGSEETPTVEKKERKPVIRMVPIFNWRTIVVVAIGFIVGAGLGLGYWIISPSLSSSSGQAEPSGVTQTLGRDSGSWESEVTIQVVNPGSAVMSLNALANKAEYYAAKANSVPFLGFLSQELAKKGLEHSYTIDELDGMIDIQYEAFKDTPAIEATVIAPTAEEAIFLTSLIPEVFKNYLVVEEVNKQQLEYENILTTIENVKTAILQAENERASTSLETVNQISEDPVFIALNAEIEVLELELERLAGELSASIIRGDETESSTRQQQEYQEILQKGMEKSIARSKARQELRDIESQWSMKHNIRNTQSYVEINAKITALEFQLGLKMTEMAVQIAVGKSGKSVGEDINRISSALVEARNELDFLESQSGDGGVAENLDHQLAQATVDNLNMEIYALRERLVSLVNESAPQEYEQDIQMIFERISIALAEARNELAILESQSSSISAEDLNYQMAQAKVDNLNRELILLNDKLSSSLVSNTETSEEIDFLAVGNPSMPVPVFAMRLRTALMLGIAIGIGGAWAVLNFRWLIKVGSSSPEEEEDEA